MATVIPVYPSVYQGSIQLFGAGNEVAAASSMTFQNVGISAFFVLNTDSATTTVTVTSVPDSAGRGNSSCDNLAITIPAGNTDPQIVQFGPFTQAWWNQPNGLILVAFSVTTDVSVIGIQYA